MPIVQSVLGQTLDDVYVIETQSPPNIQGISTGIVKMVGDFTKGVPGGVYSISDYSTAVRQLGPSTTGVNGPINLQALIAQKCGGVQVVPVFGAGAVPASVTLQDSQTTPGNVLKLTAAWPHPQTDVTTALLGTDANQMTATVQNISGSNFDLVIQYGNTIEAYKALTVATMAATINSMSNIAIASLPTGPSSQVPKVGTFQFANGTNGATLGDADFIGTIDGSGNRTGLKALEPIVGNFVFVANQSSTAINAAVAVHANNFTCIGLVCAPVSSTVSTTTSANTIKQDDVAFCDGWRTLLDPDTGVQRNVAPMAWVAGMVAQLAVYKSWGNKQVYGSTGAVTPRSNTDLATLQQSGILCLTDNIPRSGVGTRSGVSSDGSDAYVRRMRYFLELSIMTAMGWAVDEMQSSDPKDPLRKDIKGSIDTFLNPMANPLDKKNKAIDSFLTVCDLTNNPPDQIAAGNLSVNSTVRLLGAAKKIIINANISTSAVTVTSQAA